MSSTWKGVTTLCGAAVLATLVARPAAAGCVDPPTLLSQRALAPLLHSPGKGSPAFSDGQRSAGRDFDEDDDAVGRRDARARARGPGLGHRQDATADAGVGLASVGR